MDTDAAPGKEWARWASRRWWTVGVEEEVMLLEPSSWRPAQAIEEVLAAIPPELAARAVAETHACAIELVTGVHESPADAVAELTVLRRRLAHALERLGLRSGAAGTHPLAIWPEARVSTAARPNVVYASMRELARREPTFALHVHVGVGDPEIAIQVADRMRAHVPLLLALSANSPFWQGRDSGFASMRTPIFAMFPRTGIPPRVGCFEEWVDTVATLIETGAIPDPTFAWWDVRPQPRFGTVEVRVMDAQTTIADVAALSALTVCLARLEAEEGFASEALLDAPAVLAENRFLAARDGVRAELIDPECRARVPVLRVLGDALAAAAPYAQRLGCARELALVERLAANPPADRQRRVSAATGDLASVVAALSGSFASPDVAGRVA